MTNGRHSAEDARNALLGLAQEQIDSPVEYGFLGRIVGGLFEFIIPWKPGYYWCRIENALGLQEAECRSKIGLDPYTRVRFERVNGVLEAKEYVLEDAVRNYGGAGANLNLPGLPLPNRGSGGPLDMDDDDLLNVGLLQLTELMLSAATELTISSGTVTVTEAYHRIDTEADAGSDNLDTMTVVSTRPFLFWLRAENSARTVVIRHNIGNILTFSAANIDLDENYKLVLCLYDPALNKVLVLGDGAGVQSIVPGSGITVDDTDPANPIVAATGSSGAGDYILIRDEKAQNTAGGTFTSGAWQTRDLNTEVTDTGGHASLATNQITLLAGTYRARIRVPAAFCNKYTSRLQNITDTATTLLGTAEYIGAAGDVIMTCSEIVGRFTIAGTKVFEVQAQCAVTRATDGFGVAANFQAEIFTVVEFVRE